MLQIILFCRRIIGHLGSYKWLACLISCVIAVILIISFLSLSAVKAEKADQNWQLIGQTGGQTTAIAVQENNAYVGIGLRLIVLDISNPYTPNLIGTSTPFPNFVEDVTIQGTRAYVTTGNAGLRVLDISDPSNPIEIGYWDSPGYAEGVSVIGSYAFLADGPYGLQIVDVSDPFHPSPISTAYDTNYAFETALAGNVVFIAAAGSGLMVVDVSDPLNPVELGMYDTPGYAYGVAVSGTLAYVSDAWEGLLVVDITDPASPYEVGSYDTPGWALGVVILGNTVYIADGANGIRVIDVTNPAIPQEMGSFQEVGFSRRLAVSSNLAFVADLRSGMRILDVTDNNNPIQITRYYPMMYARRLDVKGQYAYVAAGFDGLRIVDITDYSHPFDVGFYDAEGGYVNSVVVSGTYAYLSAFISSPNDLYIVDVTDPTQPMNVGGISTPGVFREIALREQVIYAADEWGLRLIDVNDPYNPHELGYIQLTEDGRGGPSGVTISGTLAYLSCGFSDNVKIVDISDPTNPTLVSTTEIPGIVEGMAVANSTAYIAASFSFYILDVTNPEAPEPISEYDTPGRTVSVAISGTQAYVSDSGGGLQIVDVSNPYSPTLLSNIDTPGFAFYAVVEDFYLFIADGLGGLLIEHNNSGLPGESGHGRYSNVTVLQVVNIAEQGVQVTAQNQSNGMFSDNLVSIIGETCVVTSNMDLGPGSIRECLENAGSNDIITFNPMVFPANHPVTISLTLGLPTISQGNLTIDGSNVGVILDGSQLLVPADGIRIESDGNVIQGIQFINFQGPGVAGISILGRYNRIGGDRDLGAGPIGQGNLISGGEAGIGIYGENAVGNIIMGNLVGTDFLGSTSYGNRIGVQIQSGASYNQIGGPAPGKHNIISGNYDRGIQILDRSMGNVVAGNYIGTDISGTSALGNVTGVIMEFAAYGNVIGGNTSEERNVISGNQSAGVIISDPGTTHNTIIGNFIGTDATGIVALPNSTGISICGSGFNRVGGTKSGERNVISGNLGHGISIPGGQYTDNIILGNYIGTDPSGTIAVGNGLGISLDASALHNFIGGKLLNEYNIISGNRGSGIDLANAGVENIFIIGNIIGLDVNGITPLSNGWAGISVEDYASYNYIQNNTVAYNGGGMWWAGVYISQSPFNTVRRNSIYNNFFQGIELASGGNQMLSAPLLTTVTLMTISGNTCAGCIVEVYSDDYDEGRLYEGSVSANSNGEFIYQHIRPFQGPFVTATAIDKSGNTSEFSAPIKTWQQVFLPVLYKLGQ